MKENKNARPSVGALGQAAETGSAMRADATSNYDFTTSTTQAQAKIADLLLPGREYSFPRWGLEAITRLDGCTIRLVFEPGRRRGTLILSDNHHGYFLADDPAEAQQFARSMRHRAGEILRTARAIEGAAGLD